MNKTAKEINDLLLDNESVKNYLKIKHEIENDQDLQNLRKRLDIMRKEICKNKEADSQEYYHLLKKYKDDKRVIEYEKLDKEVRNVIVDICDILTLK